MSTLWKGIYYQVRSSTTFTTKAASLMLKARMSMEQDRLNELKAWRDKTINIVRIGKNAQDYQEPRVRNYIEECEERIILLTWVVEQIEAAITEPVQSEGVKAAIEAMQNEVDWAKWCIDSINNGTMTTDDEGKYMTSESAIRMKDKWQNYKNIYDLAILALQQYKPKEPCEWCANGFDKLVVFMTGYECTNEITPKFCPNCGNKIEGE
jgi:rubrerythrin